MFLSFSSNWNGFIFVTQSTREREEEENIILSERDWWLWDARGERRKCKWWSINKNTCKAKMKERERESKMCAHPLWAISWWNSSRRNGNSDSGRGSRSMKHYGDIQINKYIVEMRYKIESDLQMKCSHVTGVISYEMHQSTECTWDIDVTRMWSATLLNSRVWMRGNIQDNTTHVI